MARVNLRPYQSKGREDLANLVRAGKKRLLLRAPCGAGKGTICADIVQRAEARDKNSIFIVDRRVIVTDFSKRLDRLGVPHGIIMAGDPRRNPHLRTHVASIDTLYRREVLPKADLIILDECRTALSPKFSTVLGRYPDAVILGMDATPVRPNGVGLGELFQAIVELPNEAALVDMGFLVPCRVFAPNAPDLAGVKTVAGDFNEKDLAAAIDRSKIIGDIPKHWKLYADGRKTLAFGVNKKHAHEIADGFRAAGVPVATVVDDTPEAERERVWDELDNGKLLVCTGVGVFGYGFDHPIISCVISARPTKSLPLYMQQLGRGARPYQGKVDLLYLDHAGNVARHGFFDDVREWTLEGRKKKKADSEKALGVRICKVCWRCFPATSDTCPQCGTAYECKPRELIHESGELVEVKPELSCNKCSHRTTEAKQGEACPLCIYGVLKRKYTVKKMSQKPQIAALQREAEAKGYSSGWLWHRIQELGKRRRSA